MLRLVRRRLLSTARVRIVEVGPRDGLQNEPRAETITAAVKTKFIEKLLRAGITAIEAGSLVSPKWIPQMANTMEVLEQLSQDPQIRSFHAKFPILVPNPAGLERALENPRIKNVLSEVAVFVAASETFSLKNTNCSIEKALERAACVARAAKENGLTVRGYVSTAIECPYEGPIEPLKVAQVAQELERLGCYEISLGDTTGAGTAGHVKRLFGEVLRAVSVDKLAVHFHDTYGQALANIVVALEHGIRTIDASAAGLGGCPYAPGATGNVATEDVVYLLQGLGYDTGIDLDALVDAGSYITAALEQPNHSRAATALLLKRKNKNIRGL